MKNIRVFLSENCQFLDVKFSIYLNRHVFMMNSKFILKATSFGNRCCRCNEGSLYIRKMIIYRHFCCTCISRSDLALQVFVHLSVHLSMYLGPS